MSEPQTPPAQPTPGASPASFTFPLRNGANCTFSSEQIIVGHESYSVAALASAGLVADATIPTPPGMAPIPGVALATTDGRTIGFTPIAPGDCWRLLEAIYSARPELRAPLPPPPTAAYAGGFPSGPPPGYAGYPPPGSAYAPYMGHAGYPPSSPQQNNENVLAGIAHLSIFFAPLITPLIIWLATSNTMPYASRQGKQAFIFHVAITIVEIIAFFVTFLGYFLILSLTVTASADTSNPAPFAGGFFFLPFLFPIIFLPLSIGSIVLGVYAAVQTFQGRPYHYPLLGRF